jgi:hypothetical protein
MFPKVDLAITIYGMLFPFLLFGFLDIMPFAVFLSTGHI